MTTTTPPLPGADRRRGRTRWSRFAVVLAPALTVTAALFAGTATSALPVELMASQGAPLKLRIDSFSAAAVIPSTGAYETRDGERRTVLVFRIRDLGLQGLCLSQRVPTPAGAYTLRITAPGLSADRLTVAVDNISALDLLGQQLNIGSLLDLPIVRSTALSERDDSGFLDLKVGNALAAVSVTIRYFTAVNFRIRDVRLASGRAKPECF